MKKAWEKWVLHLLVAGVVAFALAGPAVAQQNDRKPASNSLVRLLQSKGILTEEEAASVSQAASPNESEQRLAKLLLSKGLISQEDYEQTVGATVVPAAADGSTGARMVPAVLRTRDAAPERTLGSVPASQKPAAAAGPKVIPAVAPIRVFPVDAPKREGLIPDLKFGPVRVKPYGFFKTTVVYDSSAPTGNDVPLPGFLPTGAPPSTSTDTGPDAGAAFHIKARAFRIGSNFEWIDPSPKLAITGRFELDFEGNFAKVTNRNISSIRSSAPTIRLAWGRLDYAANDKTTLHALFGQDWTPFGSSTLPNLLESTGLGIGFGSLYQRAPQARFGFTYNAGGSRNVKIQPEFAVVLPSFGNTPPDVGLQLQIGERQGTDSARPEIQGRIALQFQLDPAKGVAPAQLIASAMQGSRRAVVRAQEVPFLFRTAFPTGVKAQSDRFGFSVEAQLPTRYATLIAKYYNGEDLRFYLQGQLFSTYNDTTGLCAVPITPCPGGSFSTALSIDGSSIVAFGFSGTTPQVVPQRPVRSSGGFVNLGLPLSRIFNADPDGRNNGWSLYLHYGIDFAKARDVRKFSPGGNRNRSDLASAQLAYKLNSWVTFAFEQSLYRTRALPGGLALPGGQCPSGTPLLPLFRGNCAREVHNLRSEFGTIFTF